MTIAMELRKNLPMRRWPSSPFKDTNPKKLSTIILLEKRWIISGCSGITNFNKDEITNFLYELRDGKPITAKMSGLWTGVHIHFYKYVKRRGRDEFKLLCYLTETPKTVHELWLSTDWTYDQLNKRIKHLHDKLKKKGLGHLVIVDDSKREYRYSLNPDLFK